MSPASPLFAVLSVATSVVTIGGGALVLVKVWPEIRKLRAEAKKTDVDAAIAEDAADDAHWKSIIATQTEALIQPLTARIEAQDARIEQLERKVDAVSRSYRSALTYIRTLLAWIGRHHNGYPDTLPGAPAEIAADI